MHLGFCLLSPPSLPSQAADGVYVRRSFWELVNKFEEEDEENKAARGL